MSFECIHATREQTEIVLLVLRDAEEGEERIRAAILDPACTTYAAYVDGALVGAAVVRWNEDEASFPIRPEKQPSSRSPVRTATASEILYIAVVANLRGKSYGRQMIAAIQAELPEHGHVLLVGTANSSLENIAFYQKCGFRMFEVRRDFFAYIQPPLQEHGIVMRDMLVLRYDLA